jgi:hypothetical protein
MNSIFCVIISCCCMFFSCRHVWHNSVLTDILPSKKMHLNLKNTFAFSVYKLAACTLQNDSWSVTSKPEVVSGRRSQFCVLDRLALRKLALWLSRTHGAHLLGMAYASNLGCGISIVKCSLIVTIERWWWSRQYICIWLNLLPYGGGLSEEYFSNIISHLACIECTKRTNIKVQCVLNVIHSVKSSIALFLLCFV